MLQDGDGDEVGVVDAVWVGDRVGDGVGGLLADGVGVVDAVVRCVEDGVGVWDGSRVGVGELVPVAVEVAVEVGAAVVE